MPGKNFVVVGGSSGIGLGIVKQLSAQGENVTVLSRTNETLGELANVNHFAVDLMSPEIMNTDFDPNWFPDEISGLVYCPGTINLKPFGSLSPEIFRNDFELNVIGAVKVLQAAHKKLKVTKSASVILFSTVAVPQGMKYHASIAASKGAIEGLTRTLAMEFAPDIRVNCIAPSLTETPLTARFISTDEKRKASDARHPIERIGTVEDQANTALFLLSEKSTWITGQVIGVDGGMSSLRPM